MVHTLNLTEFEKNMPAADSKTVPVARRDLTTPWLGKGLPRPVRMHVTRTSTARCHGAMSTQNIQARFKEMNKHSQ